MGGETTPPTNALASETLWKLCLPQDCEIQSIESGNACGTPTPTGAC